MADFLIAYKITSKNEGGFVNDPVDSGGYTYCGITRKNFPGWRGWPQVEASKPKDGQILPQLESLVQDFYKTNFWNPIKGDSIPNQDLANQVYDMAVNSGVGTALKLLNQS